MRTGGWNMQTMKSLIKEIAGWYGVGDEVVKREMELAIMEATK